MDFVSLCYDLFIKTYQNSTLEKAHDLCKDFENYNKANEYMQFFSIIDRRIIIDFIIDVRTDNLIYTAITQISRYANNSQTIKTLYDLNSVELYNELRVEHQRIILKGALDSFNLLYKLSKEQSKELANRIANNDMSIFKQYQFKF